MAAQSHIFCTECGTPNQFHSNFCFKCGHHLQKQVVSDDEDEDTNEIIIESDKEEVASDHEECYQQKGSNTPCAQNTTNTAPSTEHPEDTPEPLKVATPFTLPVHTTNDNDDDDETAASAHDNPDASNVQTSDQDGTKSPNQSPSDPIQPDNPKPVEPIPDPEPAYLHEPNLTPAICRYYGSAAGCEHGRECEFSHSKPNSVPLCKFYNIIKQWGTGCPWDTECKFRHEIFPKTEEKPPPEPTTEPATEDLTKYKVRYHTPELADIAEEVDDPGAPPEWAGEDTVKNINTDFEFGVIDKAKEKEHLKNTGTLLTPTATISSQAYEEKQVPSEPPLPLNRNVTHARRARFKELLYYEIQDKMEDLGYGEESVKKIRGGIQKVNQYFLDIVASLIVEICAMDGVMSPVICTDPSNKPLFYKSVNAFIKTIGFPYKYAKGAAEFNSSEISRLQLVNFLLSEYQSCKMIGPQELKQSHQISTTKQIQLNANERRISKYLGDTCNVLSIQCPESAVDAIKNVEQQIKTILSKLSDSGKGFIGACMKPLLDSRQFDSQMLTVLEAINDEFSAHYSLRKNVLWKRMQVTIESILESDRAKQQKVEISKGLNKRLSALDINTQTDEWLDWDDDEEEEEENTTVGEDDAQEWEERSALLPVWMVFAAQKDIFRNDTITCITSDVESRVRKIRIGPVPDRGGRANEVRQVVIDSIPFSQYGRKSKGRGRGRGRDRGEARAFTSARYGYDSQVSAPSYEDSSSGWDAGGYRERAAVTHTPYRFNYYGYKPQNKPRAANVYNRFQSNVRGQTRAGGHYGYQAQKPMTHYGYQQQQQQQQQQHRQYVQQQQQRQRLQQQQQQRYYQIASPGYTPQREYQQLRKSPGGRGSARGSGGGRGYQTWYNYPNSIQY